MAVDKTRLGLALWTKIKTHTAFNPAITPALDAEGLSLWTDVADEILKELVTNMKTLPGNLTVTPGSFAAGGDAVTGVGTVSAGKGNVE